MGETFVYHLLSFLLSTKFLGNNRYVTVEGKPLRNWKPFPFCPFSTAPRSSIPSTSLSEYEKDPQPLEAQSLISSCNNLTSAFGIYKTLVSHQKPTLGVFKSLIEACLELEPKKAKDVWKEMEKHLVITDYWCFSLMVRACGKSGDSSLAKELFSKIKNKEFKFERVNVINCAQLIQALSYGGKMEDAMDVLDWMGENGIKPDSPLYLCLLKPCRNLATAKKIHAHIISSHTEWHAKLQNSLLNVYLKCGSMGDARSVFDSMEERDVISWNAMIGGYAQNGNGKEAFELFKQMEQGNIARPPYICCTSQHMQPCWSCG